MIDCAKPSLSMLQTNNGLPCLATCTDLVLNSACRDDHIDLPLAKSCNENNFTSTFHLKFFNLQDKASTSMNQCTISLYHSRVSFTGHDEVRAFNSFTYSYFIAFKL